MLTSLIGRLRLTGLIEGISFLVLLFIAMPLKYLYDKPEAVRIVGTAHGALFVLFVFFILQAALEFRWNWRQVGLALLASVVPFGTFYADRRLFRLYQ
jgi:integral membrane protein